MAAELKPLKLEMTVDTSAVDAALSGFVDAIKLADRHDSTGRRLTAVDELVDETIAGDARLAILAATGGAAVSAAWEAVARDLARQVINAEAEIAEFDDSIERRRDDVSGPEADAIDLADLTAKERDKWRAAYREEAAASADLDRRREVEEQAHCDTYVEACRLSDELAGWQDSDATQYRKSTAAARLEDKLQDRVTGIKYHE